MNCRGIRIILVLVVMLGCLSALWAKPLPLADWPFDEGEGTKLTDHSSGSHHGEIHGATWTDGVVGKALQFDGKSWVNIPRTQALDLQTSITMIAWVRADTLDETQMTILSKALSSTTGYDLGIHTYNKLFGRVGGGSGENRTLAVLNKIEPGKWQQVAVTYDGTMAKLFLNGALVYSKPQQGESGVFEGDLCIGKVADSEIATFRSPLFFKGAIDEVKIFAGALTDQDILEEYTTVRSRSRINLPEPQAAAVETPVEVSGQSAPPPAIPISTTGLIAYFPFSGNTQDAGELANHAEGKRVTLTDDRYKHPNSAYRFNGVDSSIIALKPKGFKEGAQHKTVAGWFRSSNTKQYAAVLFGFGAPVNRQNFQVAIGPVELTGNPVQFRINGYGDSSDWRTGVAPEMFCDGAWHHCAVSDDSVTVRFYLDGVQKAETPTYHYPTIPEGIAIGVGINLEGWNFVGDLDDIMIFNRVLSPEEIKKLATN